MTRLPAESVYVRGCQRSGSNGSLAVLFTTLLVSGNTIAMSIRERTREVALMLSLGFKPRQVRMLFLGETVTLTVSGWLFGTLAAYGMIYAMVHSRAGGPFAG